MPRKFPFDMNVFNVEALTTKVDDGDLFKISKEDVDLVSDASSDLTLTSAEGVACKSFNINQIVVESGDTIDGSAPGALKADIEVFEESDFSVPSMIVKLTGVNLESGKEIFNVDTNFMNSEGTTVAELYLRIKNRDAGTRRFSVYLRCNR